MIQRFSTEVERYSFQHTQFKCILYNYCGDFSIERYLLCRLETAVKMCTLFFYKNINIVYKNIEAEVFEILRINSRLRF